MVAIYTYFTIALAFVISQSSPLVQSLQFLNQNISAVNTLFFAFKSHFKKVPAR
jgi:hypothetical protein